MRYRYGLLTIAFACLIVGCSTTPEPSAAERQDAILSDPMGYKPSVQQDTGGGDISSFDKNGFNKDLSHVLDP